jgi:DNA-binding transcriptional LysR family regulator
MELHQLRAFVVVAEHRSVSDAADQLHIAQPALSRKIQNLEAELGLALFERGRNRMTLTKGGARLEPIARLVLEVADMLTSMARTVCR